MTHTHCLARRLLATIALAAIAVVFLPTPVLAARESTIRESAPVSAPAVVQRDAGFLYTESENGGLCITGYEGTVPAELEIPAEIGDVPVTAIGSWAFDNESSLVSLTLPESIELVGESAFQDCKSLKNVELSSHSSLHEIGDYAFAFCLELEKMDLPQSLRVIGESAFWHCSRLRAVSVPDGVEELSEGAFGYCSAMTNVSLPETLKRIGPLALAGTGIVDMEFPASVCEFGDSALMACPGLTRISVPGEPLEIPDGFAAECESLKTVELPATVVRIGEESFSHCLSLQQFTIPSSVREIGRMAFWECSSLPSAVVPEGVSTIPFGTWWGCTALQTVGLPKSITDIGGMAFYGTTLHNVYYAGNEHDWTLISIEDAGYNQFGSEIPNSNIALYQAEKHYHEEVPLLPEGVSIRPDSPLSAEVSGFGIFLTGYTAALPSEPLTLSDISDQFEVEPGMWWSATSADTGVLMPEDTVGTGDVIALQNGGPTGFSMTLVLQGDVLGSGTVGLSQVVRIARAFSGIQPLHGPYLMAGDFTGSGTIQLSDVVQEAQLYRTSLGSGLI